MDTYRSSLHPQLADIITYRFRDILVYVKPAADYEEAVDLAQQEYPELANTPRQSITFTVSANMNNVRRPVRISASAWGATVSRLVRGEVIDLVIDEQKSDSPPTYLAVPDSKGSSSDRQTRSTPPSRSHSPQPSHKSSCSVVIGNWLGKF